MRKFIHLIYDSFTFSRKFGIQGFIFWMKRIFFRNSLIKFQHKSFSKPVYLRNNTSDIPIFKQILLNEDYNLSLDFEPEFIIDCGSNIGLSAIYFKNKYPQSKIVCIEPEHTNFELLVKNTTGYTDIHCLHSGIWNKNTNLRIKDLNLGNYAFIVEEVQFKDTETIPAISIDQIMIQFNMKSIDLLKIDIEGSEKEVFEYNYEHWLSKTKIIIIELHDCLRPGASAAFYKAIDRHKSLIVQKGENIICYLNKN